MSRARLTIPRKYSSAQYFKMRVYSNKICYNARKVTIVNPNYDPNLRKPDDLDLVSRTFIYPVRIVKLRPNFEIGFRNNDVIYKQDDIM
jgi:hypothetical protein